MTGMAESMKIKMGRLLPGVWGSTLKVKVLPSPETDSRLKRPPHTYNALSYGNDLFFLKAPFSLKKYATKIKFPTLSLYAGKTTEDQETKKRGVQ